MGYYNGQKPAKKGGWFVPVLFGLLIGMLLVGVIKPMLMNSPKNDPLQNNATEDERSENAGQTKRLNVDITTRITDIVGNVAPTVVGVTNLQLRTNLWNPQDGVSEAGTGSGVIYKKDDQFAYIVTNHHVIEGADEIEIILNDDRSFDAELLGSDLFSDLAVLRMDGSTIDHVIEMGSSDGIKVGEPVIAIGNPLGHMFAGSVTQGIISGKQRTIPQDFNQDGRPDWQSEVIQTDAAINPGNSGGALINIEGQLIGINSMKINEAAVEGIGFSIPIDSARSIIEELESTGTVTRPYLGVEIYSLEEVPRREWKNTLKLPKDFQGGVYVWSVDPLSPADKVGIQQLDVITALDGKEVIDMIDLRKILYQQKQVGDELLLTFYRNGERYEVKVTLGKQD